MGTIAFVTGIFHEAPTKRSELPLLDTGGNARTTSGPNECLGLIYDSGNGIIVATFTKLIVLPGGIQVEDPGRRERGIVACHHVAIPEVQLAEVGVIGDAVDAYCQA